MKQTSALQKKIDKLQKERQLSQQAGQLHVSCESIKQLQDVVKSQSVPMSPHGSFAFSSRIPLSYGKNRCCLFGARAARLVASGYSPSTTPFFRNGSHGLVQMDLSAPQSSDVRHAILSFNPSSFCVSCYFDICTCPSFLSFMEMEYEMSACVQATKRLYSQVCDMSM